MDSKQHVVTLGKAHLICHGYTYRLVFHGYVSCKIIQCVALWAGSGLILFEDVYASQVNVTRP